MGTMRLLVHDSRRVLHALLRMFRLMRSDELLAGTIPASISLFKAPSYQCMPGEQRSYTIVLASPSGGPRLFRLIIDIYRKTPEAGTDGHVAFAVKDVLIGESPVAVQFLYDWNTSAAFNMNGTTFPADTFWRGVNATAGVHHFRAHLRTLDDRNIETLELSQELLS